jgi:hypothetical protein
MRVPLICLLAIATSLGCETKPKVTQPQTPPPEITKLVPPIEIVDATGFEDGGSIAVKLRDSASTEVVLFVNQDAFKSRIPPNALYLGGVPTQPSARLPVSSDERQIVVEALKTALEALPLVDRRGASTGMIDRNTQERLPEDQEKYWRIRFATAALEKLQSTKKYTDADFK